jgi:hypothetical protein
MCPGEGRAGICPPAKLKKSNFKKYLIILSIKKSILTTLGRSVKLALNGLTL